MSPNMNTIRVAGGGVVNLEDHQGDRPLWSSALVASTQSTDLTCFRYSRGDTIPGSSTTADERHTNSDYEGQMPGTDDMVVYSIAVEFDADVPYAAIRTLMDDLYGEFYAGGSKPLYDGLPRHFPGGSGLGGLSNATAIESYSNGVADANSRAKMIVPIHIQPLAQFKWNWKVPGGALTLGTAAIPVRTVYRGYRKLAVQ